MLNQTIAQIHTFVFKENQNNKLFVESLIEDKSMQNYVYSNQHASHFYTAYKMFLDKPLLVMVLRCSDINVMKKNIRRINLVVLRTLTTFYYNY